jgi:NAD(P)-dependent dehydrogenase (short-subunit alcohol dehydrogenase family)
VALVTGAAKGMGLATAQMFAESGASVVLADLDGDLAANEAERIVLEGGTAIGISCDVADEAQVAAMVDRAVAEYGRLDMAFNNAGIQVPPSDAAERAVVSCVKRSPSRKSLLVRNRSQVSSRVKLTGIPIGTDRGADVEPRSQKVVQDATLVFWTKAVEQHLDIDIGGTVSVSGRTIDWLKDADASFVDSRRSR